MSFHRETASFRSALAALASLGLALNLGCGAEPAPSADAAGALAALTFTGARIVGAQSSRCVDVANVSTANGAQAQLWDCNGGTNQSWTYGASQGLVVYGNKCLQPSGGGTAAGTAVVIWDCNGQAAQQWNVNGDGTITSVPSGLCMDANGAATANGTRIILWTCNGGANQRWTVSGGTTTYALTVARSGAGAGAVTSTPAGIDCGATCSASYAAGTTVTLTATAASGSTFAGWSGACSGAAPTCTVAMSAARSATAAFDAPTGTGVSVNAGGAASGGFLADAYFSGGSTYSTTAAVDTSLVPAPAPPQAVFQTERYGEFTYTVPGLTPDGAQTVTLYFAETFWTAAGQRTFDVAINGATVLTAFDIFAAAGGAGRAISRSFGATADASGQVVIAFTRGGGPDNPKISGITVASGGGTSHVLTVNKAGTGAAAGTVTSTPAGIGCGSSCAASYASGTAVTLTASASGGATFTGWSGACTGAGACVVTMTAAQSVTATFGGTAPQGPCDIYQAAGTPCVAAHSTVRALYAAYTGSLYQVRRASDGQTRDIPVLTAGGFASTSVQDSFCAGTTCTISILYDQSPQRNHLRKAPPGATWLPNGGNESSATKGRATVGGHTVYGIYVTGFSDNVAYRNNATTGVARGNQAEAMYMVVDGRRYSSACCFDYGNAETTSHDDGNGTMEAIYFGTDIAWGGRGDGNGPWIAADLENGMFKGNAGCYNCYPGPWPSAKSLAHDFVTAVLKGPAANTFTLKGGNAQAGGLTTMWNGARPSPNYYPKSLQGAIILGTGGDGSNGGTGTFFEGAMTIGNPPDSVDDAIQANVVAAGYGR